MENNQTISRDDVQFMALAAIEQARNPVYRERMASLSRVWGIDVVAAAYGIMDADGSDDIDDVMRELYRLSK